MVVSSSSEDEGIGGSGGWRSLLSRPGPSAGGGAAAAGAGASAAAPRTAAATTTSYLSFGGGGLGDSSDDEDEEAERRRRLKAQQLMLAATAGSAAAASASAASASAASASEAAGKGKPSSAAVEVAAAARERRMLSQQKLKQEVEVDSDESTADEMEVGDGGGGGTSSSSSPRTHLRRPAKTKEAAWARGVAAALTHSDSDSTTEGEEEPGGGGGKSAAGARGDVPKGFLSRKRPRPTSSSSASSAAAAAAAAAARVQGFGDSSSDEEDEEELHPTIRHPIELGALEPLVLAEHHPDDEDDDEDEDDEEGGGGKTQGGEAAVMVPAAVNRYLQEYQRDGVRWLFKNYRGSQGCVIGDEMGMGKTIQVICFLLALFKKQGYSDADKNALRAHSRVVRQKPKKGHCALLVLPASVLSQWEGELHKWGRFAVTTLKGGDANERIEEAARGMHEVALCTYAFIKGAHAQRLQRVQWRVVVFDEFHQCKNKNSETYKAAKALQARIKVGLTGTPLQNNLEELWALLSIVAPRLAGSESEFKSGYSEPMKRKQKRTASAEVVARGQLAQEKLQALLDKVILARDKRTIEHKLHGKHEFVVFCKLTNIQYDVYRNVLALPEFQLLKHRREPCDCGRRNGSRGECCHKTPIVTSSSSSSSSSAAAGSVLSSSRKVIDPKAIIWKKNHANGMECERCPHCLTLACLSRLQKVANHPCLLQYNPSSAGGSGGGGGGQQAAQEEKAYTKEFARLAFGKHVEALGGLERTGNLLDLTAVGKRACGKLRALHGLLQTFPRRDKVLLFSFSVQMLDVLAAYATHQGYEFVRLDGSVSGGERQAIIDQFTHDATKTLFLISTKAGGLGLNLAVASKVIIFDVNWNPTHDLQAMDRAYRLGQTQNVEVYRLVAQGTIEELCYMRQIYKQQLYDLALDGVTLAPPSPDSDGGGGGAGGGGASTTTTKKKKKRGRKKKTATEGIQFDSVQGLRGEEGELFGVENLLQLSRGSILSDLRRKLISENGAAAAAEDEEAAAAEDEAGEGVKPMSKEKIGEQMALVAERARDHLRRRAKKKKEGGSDEEGVGGGASQSQSQGAGFDAELPAEQVLKLLGVKAERVVKKEEDEEEEDDDEIEDASSDDGATGGRGSKKGKGKGASPSGRQRKQQRRSKDSGSSEEEGEVGKGEGKAAVSVKSSPPPEGKPKFALYRPSYL